MEAIREQPGREARATCLRCLRPHAACYCGHLVPIPTRTRVVFLQHPRESRVAIGTARMAHLALPNSELHVGVAFSGHPRVEALAAGPEEDVALLFPGEGASDLGALDRRRPQTLVVIDGTWPQARKVLGRNPLLARLPRVRFTPRRPGNYRIRSEPAAHCVSTVEAVAEALGQLEGEPERFAPMLRAFERMVDFQLEHAARREGPPRHRHRRDRARALPIPRELLARHADLVLVYAEANAHPRETLPPIPHELVQLVALRSATGARFEAIAAPRRPLAEATPLHTGLDVERLASGEPIGAALDRWRRFLRPDDLLCAWGHYPLDLLALEGEPRRPLIDLRVPSAHVLRRRPTGVEEAAALLSGDAAAIWASGRAGRRIAALDKVCGALVGALRGAFHHRIAMSNP